MISKMKGINCPEHNNTKKKQMRNAIPNLLSLAITFLLGVIASKWCINHRRKRIRVSFPLTKRYLADQLKLHFGGTIYKVNQTHQISVTWEITSTKSFNRLYKAAQQNSTGLPEEFVTALRNFASELA